MFKPWGPFLERPCNLMGPESDFDIKVSRKEGRVLTSDEVHFVSFADNFTVQFSNLLKLPPEWKTKQLNGPGNYRELRETDPRPRTAVFLIILCPRPPLIFSVSENLETITQQKEIYRQEFQNLPEHSVRHTYKMIKYEASNSLIIFRKQKSYIFPISGRLFTWKSKEYIII